MTEAERVFRRLLAKHHPDRGGDPEIFKQLLSERPTRDVVCLECGKSFTPRGKKTKCSADNTYRGFYCGRWCANRALARTRRKPKALRTGAVVSLLFAIVTIVGGQGFVISEFVATGADGKPVCRTSNARESYGLAWDPPNGGTPPNTYFVKQTFPNGQWNVTNVGNTYWLPVAITVNGPFGTYCYAVASGVMLTPTNGSPVSPTRFVIKPPNFN